MAARSAPALTGPEIYASSSQKQQRRPARGGADTALKLRKFNYAQRGKTNSEPTAMEAAFAKAGVTYA